MLFFEFFPAFIAFLSLIVAIVLYVVNRRAPAESPRLRGPGEQPRSPKAIDAPLLPHTGRRPSMRG